MTFGAIIIGRNEGERLKRCLRSMPAAATIVYVDSGSTDGSVNWARSQRIEVLELDMSSPFTAARARNAGFRCLRTIAPELPYVQFIDGDCEMRADWPQTAVAFLESRPDVGVVCGRLRERYPQNSIYNWLCDREWDGPTGEIRATGGVAMIRGKVIEAIGAYREDMIAGEEPELCVRLRAAGWRVWRLDSEMALHDAAMLRFGQWWRRAVRGGYGFAQGADLHGAPPERHYVWEARRAFLWGLFLPLICMAAGAAFSPWGWAAWLIFPLQVLRQTLRNSGSLSERATLAFYQVLVRFPEVWGELKFLRDRLLGRQTRLIEYR